MPARAWPWARFWKLVPIVGVRRCIWAGVWWRPPVARTGVISRPCYPMQVASLRLVHTLFLNLDRGLNLILNLILNLDLNLDLAMCLQLRLVRHRTPRPVLRWIPLCSPSTIIAGRRNTNPEGAMTIPNFGTPRLGRWTR